jgi:hypothetical protein
MTRGQYSSFTPIHVTLLSDLAESTEVERTPFPKSYCCDQGSGMMG